MRRLLSTVILVVVLAALAGYIYFIDARRDGTDADAKEKAFASVTAEDIEEIRIKSSDGETSRVQRADGTWRIVEPVQAAADDTELSSITSSLASLDVQRVVDEAAGDLAQYGLEPARVEVEFRSKGQKEPRRILLGEKTTTGGDLYARLPDQKRVFLVSSFIDATFNKNTFALRDKTILSFDRQKVDGVEVATRRTSVQLAKSGSEWRIVKPIAVRADFGAVEGALERLSSAQMQGIVDADGADLKKYDLDPPIASFTATSGGSKTSLLLGGTENALLFAKDGTRPMVFTVAPNMYGDVIRDVSEFRRKDLFDARSFTINRVEFRRGTETIVLTKSKADGKDVWRNGAGKDVDAMKVDDLLTKLSGLRAESFEATTSPALKSPVLTVDVTFDEKKMESVTLARAGTDALGSRADEPGTAKLTGMSLDEVITALDGVK